MSEKASILIRFNELCGRINFNNIKLDEQEKIVQTLKEEYSEKEVKQLFSRESEENTKSIDKNSYTQKNITVKHLLETYVANVKPHAIDMGDIVYEYTCDALEQLFIDKNDSLPVAKVDKVDKVDKAVNKVDKNETKLKNIDLAMAIRDLLQGFEEQKISDIQIKGLAKFSDQFKHIIGSRLPAPRKYQVKTSESIEEFKNKVLTKQECINYLKRLRRNRLEIPISELFDFILYLKESNHPTLNELNIQDGINRYSYSYFTKMTEPFETIYLDNILYANIGLVWEDDNQDESQVKISDCLKLRRETDPKIIQEVFIKCCFKDAKLFACYTLSENPYLSQDLAEDVLNITQSAYRFFPYPEDYRALIAAIESNIYKKFPFIVKKDNEEKFSSNFDTDYNLLKDHVWYKGLELTSNEYSAKKMIYSKKYSESRNDYREYLESLRQWLLSIEFILNNCKKDYGINTARTNINRYGLFALEYVKNDEIVDFLNSLLIDNKKYEKLLLKDYEFDIIVGLLSVISKLFCIIKKFLYDKNNGVDDKVLFNHFDLWTKFINNILGTNSIENLTKIEYHPDVYGKLHYSFEEILLSIRFWTRGYQIDNDRLKALTFNRWNNYQNYVNLKLIDRQGYIYLLLTCMVAIFIVGTEDEKKNIVQDINITNDERKGFFIELDREIEEYPYEKYVEILKDIKRSFE